jgi:hypothetical protein
VKKRELKKEEKANVPQGEGLFWEGFFDISDQLEKRGLKAEKENAPVTLGTHKVTFDYGLIQGPERSLAQDARARLNAVSFDGYMEGVESVVADKAQADSKKVAFEGMEGVDSGLAVLARIAVEGVRAAEKNIAPVADMEGTGEWMNLS